MVKGGIVASMQFAQIFFYLSVGVGVWIIVIGLTVLIIEVISTVRLFRKTVTDVRSGIADLENLKNSLKLGIFALVGNLIGKSNQKGGGKNAK